MFKYMTEKQRKEICDYMLTENINHEAIHNICTIMDKFFCYYEDEISKQRKQVDTAQDKLNRIATIASGSEWTTFNEGRTNNDGY